MPSPTPKEHPVLFKGPMVRAILDGSKVQTRRPIKGVVPMLFESGRADAIRDLDGEWSRLDMAPRNWELCPLGVPGDLLWVRETWCVGGIRDEYDDGGRNRIAVDYRASPELTRSPWCYPPDATFWNLHAQIWDQQLSREKAANRSECPGWEAGNSPDRWRPSIHMPRWASRLTLLVTDVRVERLQEISEADARAEGTAPICRDGVDGGDPSDWSAIQPFVDSWDGIYAKQGLGWAANVWVWAVTFEVLDG